MINKTLSLVIPCCNEEKMICQLVKTVIRILSKHVSLKLVVVGDYSMDSGCYEIRKIRELYLNNSYAKTIWYVTMRDVYNYVVFGSYAIVNG